MILSYGSFSSSNPGDPVTAIPHTICQFGALYHIKTVPQNCPNKRSRSTRETRQPQQYSEDVIILARRVLLGLLSTLTHKLDEYREKKCYIILIIHDLSVLLFPTFIFLILS